MTDKEAKEFYDKNKEMVAGAPFEKVKDSIKQFIGQQKKQAAVESYVKNLGQGANMQISQAWVKKQYALAMDNPVDKARKSGIPTMVEFGATGCVPCDMMQPILENLRKGYKNRLNVVFVHVGEEQILGARFGIRAIPVQVFYNGSGKEVFRHEGFFAEDLVKKTLKQIGVN